MAARGGWLLLVLMLGLTVYDMGWFSFPTEESPALRVSGASSVAILLLDTEGKIDGIHQINDAQQLLFVINLAGLALPAELGRELVGTGIISEGEMIKFQVVNGVVTSFEFGWMPAAMRMSLGIPLNVDQMSVTDWDDLPGVGASLTLRIEQDRQKNGDFDSIYGLSRVPGVGLKLIEKWKLFFRDPK